MRLFKLCASSLLVTSLTACAVFDENDDETADEVTRRIEMSANWQVADVRVTTPETLIVSEENLFYPEADVVWRGEPFGDRLEQVAEIMDDGLTSGLVDLDGSQEVYFDVTVKRFHSLTELARVLVGGVHNMIYELEVKDVETGEVLYGPKVTEIDLAAFGGQQAFDADRNGETQKQRILRRLKREMEIRFPG